MVGEEGTGEVRQGLGIERFAYSIGQAGYVGIIGYGGRRDEVGATS